MLGLNSAWRRGLVGGPMLAATLAVSSVWAQDHEQAPERATEQDASARPYMRIADDDGRVALEIAVREFEPEEGDGPRVGLVAVAHISDQDYYNRLQDVLESYDLVLYESVLPAGAGGPGGATDKERAASTEVSMRFLASLIELHEQQRGAYPVDLETLARRLNRRDGRLGGWVKDAAVDGWGHPLVYDRHGADGNLETAPTAPGYELRSAGADGKPGGEGFDADIVISSRDRVAALPSGEEDNMQAELADALGLAYQLEAIDYDQPDWLCSDMAFDEVERALNERGADMGPLTSSLNGTSLPLTALKFMLRLVKLADAFLGGAIADMCKVLLIEFLGDDQIVRQSLDQMGAAFEEVIVDLRNQVVIDDLKVVLDERRDVESIAIFYGAAHMHDMEERLADQLGYQPVDDERGLTWHRAIEVDLKNSAISEAELQRMRQTVRQMMRMQQ